MCVCALYTLFQSSLFYAFGKDHDEKKRGKYIDRFIERDRKLLKQI